MHARIDAHSLERHRLIAERVRAKPALRDVALAILRRWRQDASPGAQADLALWEGLLLGPMDELLSAMTAPDEISTRLRQSSPFAGNAFTTPKERRDLLRQLHEPGTT